MQIHEEGYWKFTCQYGVEKINKIYIHISKITHWIKLIYYNILYEFNLIKIPILKSNALNGISISFSTKFNYDSNEFNSTIGLRLGCKLVKKVLKICLSIWCCQK
jgi:hypothetical protein